MEAPNLFGTFIYAVCECPKKLNEDGTNIDDCRCRKGTGKAKAKAKVTTETQ